VSPGCEQISKIRKSHREHSVNPTGVWTGPVAGYAFDFVTMATYHCCVVIWLMYLWAPEAARSTVKEVPENALEQWNAELQRLLLQ
jgi:hypothetical protein